MRNISKVLLASLCIVATHACASEDAETSSAPDGSADAPALCPLSASTCTSSDCTAIRGARLSGGCLEKPIVIGCYVSGSILITLDIACVKHVESGDLYQINSGSSLVNALVEDPDWESCTADERGEVVAATGCG